MNLSKLANGTAAVVLLVQRYRVASSAAACASLRRNRCTASTASGIMAARRQTCGCGCGAESMPLATLPDRRRSARPLRAVVVGRVESRSKERRNRVAAPRVYTYMCVRTHTHTHTVARGDIRAQKFTSRKCTGHRASTDRKNCFLRFHKTCLVVHTKSNRKY